MYYCLATKSIFSYLNNVMNGLIIKLAAKVVTTSLARLFLPCSAPVNPPVAAAGDVGGADVNVPGFVRRWKAAEGDTVILVQQADMSVDHVTSGTGAASVSLEVDRHG